MIRTPSIPLHRNPALRPGLAALTAWLQDGDYNAHAIGRIVAHAASEGTPTGCPDLDPSDEYGASSVFCDTLDLVPYSSSAWDAPDAFLDAVMLAEGTHPLPFGSEPPDGPDAPDAGRSWSAHLGELIATGRTSAVPALSGGAPGPDPDPADWHAACAMFRREDPAPFVPTADDLAEMRAHFDRIDAAEARYGYE